MPERITIKEDCTYNVRPVCFREFAIYEHYAPNQARIVYEGTKEECNKVLRYSQYGKE